MTHVLQTGGFQCRARVLPAPAPCVHFTLPAAHAHAAAELHSCRARGGAALRSRRCVEGRERKSETIRKSCGSPSLSGLSSLEKVYACNHTSTSWQVYYMRPSCPSCSCTLKHSAPSTCAACRLCARRAERRRVLPAVLAQAGQKFDYDLAIIGCGVGGHGAALHAVECVRPQDLAALDYEPLQYSVHCDVCL